MLYDNLATVRRMQKEWSAATAASDEALKIFEVAPGPTSARFGYALNAVAILREALKNDPRSLEPFLEDNQALKRRQRPPGN